MGEAWSRRMMNTTEDPRYAQFMKTFAVTLGAYGLRSPKYYEDKSQCISFVEDVDPVVKGYTKGEFLKGGYIEPKDLIERLRQLKPSENFELHNYQHLDISWTKSPLCRKEKPHYIQDNIPGWLVLERKRAYDIVGRRNMAQFDHLWNLLRQRWEKVDLSIDRAPLPDLHLLKNMGSSPNGTLYPLYLVEGLYALRDRAEMKTSEFFAESHKRTVRERDATISEWKNQHPDVKLRCHPISIFRTWPSDLMDKLDEIDRETARFDRSSYIGFLEEAEKEMQELLKFWRECGLITGQRTPPSPDVQWRDSSLENPSRADRESGGNRSPSDSVSSSPTEKDSRAQFTSQKQRSGH